MDSKSTVVLFCTLISGITLDGAECSTINKEEKQKYSSIPAAKISPRKKYVDLLTDGSFKREGSGRNLWLEKGCPFGTLPIPRATGEQLGRDKFLYPEALNYSIKNNGVVDSDGEWWLFVDDNIVGYWSGALFTSLRQSANTIRFGGQVFSRDDATPPMGSGRFAGENTDRTAYMHHIEVVSKDNSYITPPSNIVQTIESRCYFVGSSNSGDPSWGYNVLYGGKVGKNHFKCPVIGFDY